MRKRKQSLGDAIRAGRVLGRGHDDFGTKAFCGHADAVIVSSDHQVIELVTFPATLPHMLQQRFANDEVQRFTRKARRAPTSRQDANDACG
jgi:hypothetical protein